MHLKIQKPFYIFFIIINTILLIGCCKNPFNEKVERPMPYRHDDEQIERNLTTSAASIEQSLGILAQTQDSSEPAIIDTIPLITPEGGMGGRVDIDWIGPIAPLVYKLASMTKYKLKIFGNEPAIPVIVTLTKKRAVIADILKNASLQARNRASVVIFPENKVIEIRYK